MKTEILEHAKDLYHLPLFDLIDQAHRVYRENHDLLEVQKCALLSVKTGGCPEDCAYCPQSAHYKTSTERHGLLPLEEVKKEIKAAKNQGAERFCMGAAWRNVKDGEEFDQVLEMVKAVKAENMEACVTLGMLNESQANRLKEAGLDAYNHNLDTSEGHYSEIIHTRTYQDRLNTLGYVRNAGINVCSGGILGLGESGDDRCAMLAQLASMSPQPESVPINLLIPVEGTPLENSKPVDPLDLVRTVAVARILMPKSRVRLSAGRDQLSREAQVLAFFAGANSIFLGEKLLTRSNPRVEQDEELLNALRGTSREKKSAHPGLTTGHPNKVQESQTALA